jgi:hypothetical protein
MVHFAVYVRASYRKVSASPVEYTTPNNSFSGFQEQPVNGYPAFCSAMLPFALIGCPSAARALNEQTEIVLNGDSISVIRTTQRTKRSGGLSGHNFPQAS